MADDGGAKAPGVTCRNTAGEENPRVGAIPRPRDFQRRWNTQFLTGLHEGSCVVTPVGLVKVRSEEVTSVIFQQRIDTDHVLACKMIVDHCVGHWDQQAVAAIAAFDARLFADPGAPFVGTGRCVARLA